MRKVRVVVILFILILGLSLTMMISKPAQNKLLSEGEFAHWLLLHRKSDVEFLYYGIVGDKKKSRLVRIFRVKAGIPGKRPTPLPQLLGRQYWLVTNKVETIQNSETAPYFLTLDIPVLPYNPYGPESYLECNGQCDWVLPGNFGLHGVNGENIKLSVSNLGSSGCVRHSDADITYLYQLLDPQKGDIRYYIEDV